MLFGGSEVAVNFRAGAQEALNSLLSEAFNTGAGKVSQDNLLQASLTGAGMARAQAWSGYINDKTKLTRGQFNKIINDMRKWLNSIEKNQNAMLSLQQQTGYAGNAQKALSSFRGRLTKLQNMVTGGLGWRYGKDSQATINSILSANNDYGYGLLNKCIYQLAQVQIPAIDTSANQQGLVGEWFAAWIKDFLVAKSNESAQFIKEQMQKSAIAANKGSTGGYYCRFEDNGDLKELSDSQKNKALNKNINGNYSKVKFVYHTSKTDASVEINYKTDSYKDIKVEQNFSIKNYKQTNQLSIVNNTPLESILQFSKNQRWAAHWVNVMSPHEDEGKLDAGFLTQARKSFNEVALYVGLVGYLENNKPTVFLVFNSNTKKVKAFDPILLMNELIENKSFSIITDNGSAKADLSQSGKLFNNWSSTVNNRMNKVIASLHANKVHIKINLSSK